jgi:hypothetical protein
VLLGGTLEEQALVEQWIHFADTEIHPFSGLLNGLFAHKIPYSKAVRSWSPQPFIATSLMPTIFPKAALE